MLICIGGTAVDIHAEVERPLRRGTSNPGKISMSPGGVGRNIAENAARLGIPTTLVTWIGDDPLSAWVLDRTRGAGVRVIAPTDRGGTGSRYLSVLEEGEPVVAVSDFGPFERAAAVEVTAGLDEALRSTADRARPLLVAVDCNLPREALAACIDWCEQKDALLLVEPVSVAKLERLRGLSGSVTCITPNIDEARALLEMSGDAPDIKTWIVTRGGAGAALWRNGEDHAMLYRTRARRVVNANGAGDAFVAGLLAALHDGLDPGVAIRWAAAAGAITVAAKETVAPEISREAILRQMDEE